MKGRIQGMLASAAGAVAIFASAGIALADGMPGGPGYRGGPAQWSGFYVGFESGWNWDRTDFDSKSADIGHAKWDRDAINEGLFLGYQHQFGPLVVGVEADFIGNQFDNQSKDPAPEHAGNCANPSFNCVGRVTDLITVGPRVGWAIGNFMPYGTGGYASGSINFRQVGANGITAEQADARSDGWYAGGGLDWKPYHHVVVGIEYRHTDLGAVDTNTFDPSKGTTGEPIRLKAESDAVMVRGSLLFGGRGYEPLK